MKIKYLLGIMTLLVVVSCAKESDIDVRAAEVVSKFEFPQGDSESDKKLVAIYEKFGTRCIYKDISTDDLNKSWNVSATGETGYRGDVIEDQKLLNFYATFFADNVFRFFDKENARGILPPNIYFVNNYVKVSVNIYESIFPNAKPFFSEPQYRIFTGLDFWGFCFSVDSYVTAQGEEKNEKLPATPFEYSKYKEVIIKNILDKMMVKGRIVPPNYFDPAIALDLDYNTPIKNLAQEVGDKDYYKRRGFPETVRGLGGYYALAAVFNSAGKPYVSPSLLFKDYVWIGLRYTKEQIETNYKDFPLIIKYYNMVAQYLLTNYRLDLNAMATYPELID